MVKVQRKRCTWPGCKKYRVAEQLFCKLHDPVSPHDVVIKMNEIECLRLGKLDAEREAALGELKTLDQDLKLSEYKLREGIADLQRQFDEYAKKKYEERKKLVQDFERKHQLYRSFVQELADRFSLDPDQMTYDTDTGVLRDLRNVKDVEGEPPL